MSQNVLVYFGYSFCCNPELIKTALLADGFFLIILPTAHNIIISTTALRIKTSMAKPF